jgi:histidinol-phosphatase
MSFSKPEITQYADFAMRLADAARVQTLPRFRSGLGVSNKAGADFDPVTDADRESERVMREMISKTYPAHGIIGEEFGATPGAAPWRWVLDPIDGTRAFVCGVPSWTTLIALEYEERPVLGLIDQPYTDERWIAENGVTRFLHGEIEKDCRTSGVEDLSVARISTTDPRPRPAGYISDEEAAAFARLASETRLARFSMDAYAYALLAHGELDLVVEAGLSHHDYVALVPVVEGAGGVITNWSGAPVGSDARGETVAAATSDLHAAALKILAG